jgi:calcineurin-like phosphoesterase family protein
MHVFVTSDSHFGQAGMLEFLRPDGSRLRPFASVEEHDDHLVAAWNARVQPTDKVYHLGDVAMHHRAIATIGRCNGRKVLIKGNHDTHRLTKYLPWFYDVRAYHVLDKLVLSHVPIHPESLGRFRGNVHGHLHAQQLADPRYQNVCVEHTHWAPLELSEVQQLFRSPTS